MKLTARISILGLAAMTAAALGAVACSESDSNNGNASSGGKTSAAEGGSSAGGATTAAGGAAAAEGGAATAAGGAAVAAGGAAAAAGGATGECNYPTANAAAPADHPVCTDAQKKGASCTTEGAGFVCYRTCGPTNSSGWKTETCNATTMVFDEVSTCTWTGTDYSAFKIPASAAEMNAACPTDAPQATTACTVPACVSCQSPSGSYLDSGGASKGGWCTCVHKADGTATWSCGTAGSAWPCPGQTGC